MASTPQKNSWCDYNIEYLVAKFMDKKDNAGKERYLFASEEGIYLEYVKPHKKIT